MFYPFLNFVVVRLMVNRKQQRGGTEAFKQQRYSVSVRNACESLARWNKLVYWMQFWRMGDGEKRKLVLTPRLRNCKTLQPRVALSIMVIPQQAAKKFPVKMAYPEKKLFHNPGYRIEPLKINNQMSHPSTNTTQHPPLLLILFTKCTPSMLHLPLTNLHSTSPTIPRLTTTLDLQSRLS